MSSKQQLILLVNSLCEIQDRILSVRGMPDYIKRPITYKVEPLKAPMCFVWERLGYGSHTALSPRGINDPINGTQGDTKDGTQDVPQGLEFDKYK